MDLWLAAQTGDLRRVCTVLGSKDDGRACESEDCSWPEVEELNRALFVAAANDHAPVVETLLQAKASVDGTDMPLSPLHVAVWSGAVRSGSQTLAVLVKAGASVNFAAGAGVSPLLIAARSADTESVSLLISAKASVAAAHRAAARFHQSLLAAAVGACVPRRGGEGQGQGGREGMGAAQAVQCLQLLLRSCPWLAMHAPLVAAAQLEDPAVLQALLDAKAAPDGAHRHSTSAGAQSGGNTRGLLPPPRYSPLYYAVRSEQLKCVHLLASRGACVITPDALSSPVHVALKRGYDAGLQVLLQYADVASLRTESGHALLHWAARHGRVGTVHVLLEAGARPEVFSDAVSNTCVLRLLLKAKADPNRGGWDGSRLCAAVCARSVESVRLLVEAKADPNCPPARHGSLPLALAAAQPGSVHMVRTLLASKALVDALSGLNRHTALHEAVRAGNGGAAKVLVAAGASACVQDAHGNVPAVYASAHDHVLRRLLSADPTPAP